MTIFLALNEQKGDMYPWCDLTYNPAEGLCPHLCDYCFIQNSFLGGNKYEGEIGLVEGELQADLGSGNTIFVCSAFDLFAEKMDNSDIMRVLEHCRDYPDNTYLFQTKNPKAFRTFKEHFPDDIIIGTTLESNRRYNISEAPSPPDRYRDFRRHVHEFYDDVKTMISIEPIMDFDPHPFLSQIIMLDPDFVSVGADSKDTGLDEPGAEKVYEFCKDLDEITEVRIKKNLKRLLGEEWYEEVK